MAKHKTQAPETPARPAPAFTRMRDGGVRLGGLTLRADYLRLAEIEEADGGRSLGEVLMRSDRIGVQLLLVRILGGFETNEEAAEVAGAAVKRYGSYQFGAAINAAISEALGAKDDEDEDEPGTASEDAPGES